MVRLVSWVRFPQGAPVNVQVRVDIGSVLYCAYSKSCKIRRATIRAKSLIILILFLFMLYDPVHAVDQIGIGCRE